MVQRTQFVFAGVALIALGLSGCGGGKDDPPPPPASTYTVGGNLTGLTGNVVLRLNGANDLTVNASGAFSFANQLAGGAAYSVTVQTQPATQTCAVTGGSGNIGSANVVNVAVACTTNTFTVGGAVAGSIGPAVLQLNGANNLTVAAAGDFTFANPLPSGTNYTVTVLTPPAQQACTVSSGTGTIASANLTNVTVTCANIPTLSGVVAVGTPLVGNVTVKDAVGATRTAVIGVNGSYSINVAGMTAPFVLRAEGSANGHTYVIHSAAVAADLGGNINITQLTDLAIANMAGQIASAYFNAGNFGSLTKAALDAEVTLLRTRLLPVLQALGVDASIDLLRARFTPAASALDDALDTLRVTMNMANTVAIITNVVTRQQIMDDITVPAASETNPTVMNTVDNLVVGITDREAVRAAVAAFGALFANGLPSPATLAASLADNFLSDDQNRAEIAAFLASETNLAHSVWTDVDVKGMNYDNPAAVTAVVDFTIKTEGGVERDRVTNFGLRRDPDNVWRFTGNQRVLYVSSEVVVYRSSCTSTGIEFEIDDENPANNGGVINHIMVFGPGLPAGGLRYEPTLGGDYVISGQQGGRYEFSNDCGYTGLSDAGIAAIPDNAIYFFAPFTSADNSTRLNFPGGLVLPGNLVNGTYVNTIERRAPTLAEAVASTSYPSIAAPANAAAFASYNGGALPVSVGNLNPTRIASVTLEYFTRLGNNAEADAELVPTAGGTRDTTLSLPPPPAGDAITWRGLRASQHDAYRRWFLYGYGENFYTVSGTVTGLTGTVTLRLNGGSDLVVNAPGPFTFATSLANGASYNVTVGVGATHQTCGVPPATGVGTINGANVTNVSVLCSNYSLGGQITGLSAPGLVLQVNGGNDLAVPVGATFAFPTSVSLSTPIIPQIPSYNIHIASQPAGQTCTITGGTGIVSLAAPNITSPRIQCLANVTSPLSGTYRLTSLDGAPPNHLRAYLTFLADGTYMFGLHEDDASCGVGAEHGGLEYGAYRWNETTHAFQLLSVVLDTNGECGLADDPADLLTGTLVKNPDGTLTLASNDPDDSAVTVTPVPSIPGTLIGSWGNNQDFTVFDANGTVFNGTTRGLAPLTNFLPGIEDGCYLLSGTTSAGTFALNLSGTCAVSGTQVGVDTTGPGSGLSIYQNSGLPMSFSVAGNVLTWYDGGAVTPRLTPQ